MSAMPLNLDSRTLPVGPSATSCATRSCDSSASAPVAAAPFRKSRRLGLMSLPWLDGGRNRRHIEFLNTHGRNERGVALVEPFAEVHRHRLPHERQIAV